MTAKRATPATDHRRGETDRTSISLYPEDGDWARADAQDQGLTLSAWIRRLIRAERERRQQRL